MTTKVFLWKAFLKFRFCKSNFLKLILTDSEKSRRDGAVNRKWVCMEIKLRRSDLILMLNSLIGRSYGAFQNQPIHALLTVCSFGAKSSTKNFLNVSRFKNKVTEVFVRSLTAFSLLLIANSLGLFSKICRIHPNFFFLFGNVTTHQRVGAFVTNFVAEIQ